MSFHNLDTVMQQFLLELDAADTYGDHRDVLRKWTGDPFVEAADIPKMEKAADIIATQKGFGAAQRQAVTDDHYRAASQATTRDIYEYLKNPAGFDTGSPVTHRVGTSKTGKRFKAPISGKYAVTVPTGNDEYNAAFHEDGHNLAAGREFSKYINPAEGYLQANGQAVSGRELAEKYGIAYGQDAKNAVHAYLTDAAPTGELSPEEIKSLAGQFGLPHQQFVKAHPEYQAQKAASHQANATARSAGNAVAKALKPFLSSPAGGAAPPTTPVSPALATSPDGGGPQGPLTYGQLQKVRAKVIKATPLPNGHNDDDIQDAVARQLAKEGWLRDSDTLKNAPDALFNLRRKLAISQFNSGKIVAGRSEEIGTDAYKAELHQFLQGEGVATGRDRPRAPKEISARATSVRQKQQAIREKYAAYLKDKGREAEVGSLGAEEVLYGMFQKHGLDDESATKRILGMRGRDEKSGDRDEKQRQARYDAAQKRSEKEQARQDRLKERQGGKFDKVMRHRASIKSDLENEWADDLEKRKLIGGGAFKEELARRYKDHDVDMEGDGPKKKRASFDLYKGSLLIGAMAASVRSGAQFGSVVGGIAQGLTEAVTGGARLFTGVGEAIIGQVLAPLGKAGAFAGKITGTLANTLLSGVSAVGGLAAAGLKVGAALAGGIVGGLGAAVGAGIGAVIGGVLLPGVGALGGAVAGAGVFAALGGALMAVVGQVGGAVGQALGAVGKAFGEVGKSITDTLGSVQGVLSDLIDTGKEFASAGFAVQRGTGQGLGSAGGVASLSKMLTGNPGGLNGIFSGFGMEGPYMAQRARAFGVGAGPGAGFLDILQSAQGQWNRLGGGFEGSIRRGEMVNGMFGGNQDIANLLSSGMAGRAVAVARATAPTAKEMKQDFALSMDMSLVGRQIDSIKTKFLSDLMPVLKLGLGMFGSFLSKNMGGIVGGLKAAGEWLFVQFPTLLGKGVNMLFEFGKSFAMAMPAIGEFGKGILATVNVLALAAKSVGTFFLTMGSMMHLIPRSVASAGVKALHNFNGLPLDGMNAQIDRFEMLAPEALSKVNNAQVGFNKYYGGLTGSESARQKAWDKAMGAGAGGGIKIDSTVKVEPVNNPDSLYKLKADVTGHVARQFVRGQARAGA